MTCTLKDKCGIYQGYQKGRPVDVTEDWIASACEGGDEGLYEYCIPFYLAKKGVRKIEDESDSLEQMECFLKDFFLTQ